MTEMTS